jgi:hypothetical protein
MNVLCENAEYPPEFSNELIQLLIGMFQKDQRERLTIAAVKGHPRMKEEFQKTQQPLTVPKRSRTSSGATLIDQEKLRAKPWSSAGIM